MSTSELVIKDLPKTHSHSITSIILCRTAYASFWYKILDRTFMKPQRSGVGLTYWKTCLSNPLFDSTSSNQEINQRLALREHFQRLIAVDHLSLRIYTQAIL